MSHAVENQNGSETGIGGWRDVSDRTLIGIYGEDRRRLLQGFCTADIEKLEVGDLTEAMILNGKGKTIGFVRVRAEHDRLLLDSDPGQFDPIVNHLDRYVIREDVRFEDESQQLKSIVVCGDAIRHVDSDSTIRAAIDGEPGINRWDFAWLYPQSCILRGSESAMSPLRDALRQLCGEPLSATRLDRLRIRAGVPAVGSEVNEEVLPQELRRDELAISFTKGCYLGQETVARIDALGHVNRYLVGMRIEGERPAAPVDLEHEGKTSGKITCVADADDTGGLIGLAFVRRALAKPGTQMSYPNGTATVIELPME